VGILGLGLIGGSLALDLSQLGYQVLGVSLQTTTCALACQRGAVRVASTDWQLLAGADLIFVCVPLDQTVPSVARLAEFLPEGVVISDVASVKADIVAHCSWPWFVGGHPMAGTAQQGMGAAVQGLFRDRPYVLTPTVMTDPEALISVQMAVQDLGAKLVLTDPVAHDRAVALVSHAPVFVSAALLLAGVQADTELLGLARQLASTGFADTTRIGGGNPELGLLMARHNRAQVLVSLAAYQTQLQKLHQAITEEDWAQVVQALQTSQRVRGEFSPLPPAPPPYPAGPRRAE